MTFTEALAEQRWDDHRYYHHNLINQSLHLVSAVTFLACYAVAWTEPTLAVLLAWMVAMPSRQIGHFFFEPKTYDAINEATHDHKEDIKVGYNLRRKVLLHIAWAASPLLLLADPSFGGWLTPAASVGALVDNIARIWMAVAAAALFGRGVLLSVTRDVQTGVVWVTKILTDPFHDVKLYHQAPLRLLKGEPANPAAFSEPA
jgi:hypothetical protein